MLSEKIEISEKHYGQLERGSFSPSLETFFKLVEVLNIPLSEFGIKINNVKNKTRNELLKETYTLSDSEMELYFEIIKLLKRYEK